MRGRVILDLSKEQADALRAELLREHSEKYGRDSRCLVCQALKKLARLGPRGMGGDPK